MNQNYFNDGRSALDVWFEIYDGISENAANKNGRELLAEIFTLYKKGGIESLKQEWVIFFNQYTQSCLIEN